MAKRMNEERRKHPRVNSNIVISYHIQQEQNNYDVSQTKNVSQGGMLLTTNRRFEKGTRLAMTVLFPFLEDKIEVVGEVVGSKEVVKDLIYETRLRFSDLKEQLIEGLSEFVGKNMQ
jgi:hypothetical protein